MKIDGQIDFFVNRDETRIIIHCKSSNAAICEVTLTPEQLSSALSRLSLTPCKVEFYEMNTNKIGKQHKHDTLEFELPESLSGYKKDKVALNKLVKDNCPDGWEPDYYLGSQGSFFKKYGKEWARVTIRTWI